MKQNISKLKLKPTSNYTKSIKILTVSYTRGKEENIRTKNVLDSKEFSKKMRPIFCLINTMYSQISIGKDNRIVSDNFDLSEEFSTVFEDAVRLLSVKSDKYYLSDTENSSDSVDIDIRKFENHPIVQANKENISENQDFYFSNTKDNDLLKEVSYRFKPQIEWYNSNIPKKCLKEVPAICAPPLNNICNKETITQKSFPNNPRISDVTPVLDVTPEDASLLKNYILFSVLSVVSTIYERTMQKQILEYID